MPLTDDAALACLGCHVTNPESLLRDAGPLGGRPRHRLRERPRPGVRLAGRRRQLRNVAIGRPSLASGAGARICAECHSPRGKAVSPDDPTSIRFQGTTLTWSRCYTESSDKLDCLTCHDPHRDASTSTAHYEAKCLECHAGHARAPAKGRAGVPPDATQSPVCPVNPTKGCISCHMPKVGDVIPHSPFTDHFIRVHRTPPTTNAD